MTFIIDPMFIYWLQVLPVIGTIVCVLGWLLIVGFGIAWAVFGIMYSMNAEFCGDDSDVKKALAGMGALKKKTALITIISLVLLFGSAFVPAKETLIGMYVASVATKENVASAYKFTKDEIKDLVTFTVGTINGTITNTLDHLPLKADITIKR